MTSLQSAAWFYRAMGWNPLPSCRLTRHPVASYADLWDTPIEPTVIEHWPHDIAENIQLMTGTRWGLVVIDLDGSGAMDAWRSLTLYRPMPRTWMVCTGAGGLHLYFRTDADSESRIAGGVIPHVSLWKGVEAHEAVEVLGDRCLVTAPPSLHHRTGEPYIWLIGPSLEMPRPAPLPDWLCARAIELGGDMMRGYRPASCRITPPESAPRKGLHFDRTAVLKAIRDKIALVRSWGLRITGKRPTCKGWVSCRSIHRPDKHPSCGFHTGSGYYCEPAERLRLSLFDVGVALGVFRCWTEACNTLGAIYL